MHTSTRLKAGDFVYRRGEDAAAFADIFPDYHPQDRVAFVTPDFRRGITDASLLILALNTAFYDALRDSDRGGFFAYPQCFCFFDHREIALDAVGAAYGNLDVWPAHQWIAVDNTPSIVLRAVWSRHINRLFLPEGWGEAGHPVKDRLPDYARPMLATGLKQVAFYATDEPVYSVTAATPVPGEIIGESLRALPGTEIPTADVAAQTLRPVDVDTFLAQFSDCFAG